MLKWMTVRGYSLAQLNDWRDWRDWYGWYFVFSKSELGRLGAAIVCTLNVGWSLQAQ